MWLLIRIHMIVNIFADWLPMSYDPLKVIDVLTELPGVPKAVVSAVTARIAFKESIDTRELLKVLEECGVSPDQAMTLRKSLQRGATVASTSSPASASGAPRDTVRVQIYLGF